VDTMSNVPSGLLAFIVLSATLVHIAGSYIFFRLNLEKIEDQLSDIDMFYLNRNYYGDSFLGRKMRENFITLVLVAPEIFKKQEIIPRHKLLKLSYGLRWGVRFIFLSMLAIFSSAVLLYFFRLRH
jgi:hypothetical protein